MQDFEAAATRDLSVEWSLSRSSAIHVEESASSDESSDDDWISFLWVQVSKRLTYCVLENKLLL